ncbi:MAG: PsbP-related protein [bacterium]|nr:PsbP-related protein [bacterium]
MQSLRKLIWVVVAVLIVAVVGVVYAGVRSTQELRRANAVPARETQQTAEWPSYRNAETGIAFRYPQGWEIEAKEQQHQIVVRPKVVSGRPTYDVVITISENPEGVTAVAYAQRDLAFNETLRTAARGYRWYATEGLSGYEVFEQVADGALHERIYFTKGSKAFTFVFPLANGDPTTIDFVEQNRLVHLLLGTLEFT